MRWRVDNLMWVPVDEVRHLSDLQRQLTLYTTPFKGEPERMELYEMRDGLIGVPRVWGRSKLAASDDQLDFQLAMPDLLEDWPTLTFPEGWDYWDGQRKSVEDVTACIASDCTFGGLLEAPCGSGKTLMGLDVASRLRLPTLIVVHKTDLADQWRTTALGGVKDGEKVPGLFPGCRFGHIQGDRWDWRGQHVVTATAQTLYSRLDSIPAEFWRAFGLVIYDEGHRYPARTFEQILRATHGKRLAVSATWRRKDGMECVWHWHVGDVLHRTRSERLVGEYVQVPWKTSLWDGSFNRRGSYNTAKLITEISVSEPFNDWIADQVVTGVDAKRKLLVVGDRVEQLVTLRGLIHALKADISTGLYVGSVAGRRRTKDQLAVAKEADVVLATYGMMAEGTDIPSLDTLLFATPRSDVEQVVGRIQRHAKGKRGLLIVDPVFALGFTKNMAKKRADVYHRLGFKPAEK